jgi:hypothetical protein
MSDIFYFPIKTGHFTGTRLGFRYSNGVRDTVSYLQERVVLVSQLIELSQGVRSKRSIAFTTRRKRNVLILV